MDAQREYWLSKGRLDNLASMLNTKKPAILIVEDHDKLRAALAEWLNGEFKEVSFLVAESAEKAIEIVKLHHPAIVIMDIQLPRMNGIEAIRNIKLISPQTQAVVLTVMKDSDFIDIAMAAGATAFIHKQHMYDELIPTLTKLLPPEITAGKEVGQVN